MSRARKGDPETVLGEQERALLRARDHPSWIDPMLATLTDRRFSDPNWIFERKLDGIRCLAFRSGETVRLLSRNKQRLDNTYPEIADALLSQPERDFVVDGEIVAFERGRTSFALLQQRSGITDPVRARKSNVAVEYHLFDILHVGGFDTMALPLRTRKQLLRTTIEFAPPLKFTVHRNGEGERLFDEGCSKGWEGVIAKRADSAYSSRRSTSWLKFKCERGQEFVVGGFTEPAGTRLGLGALLLGYYEGDELLYAGKVGTGFDDRTLRELRSRLDDLEVARSPFSSAHRYRFERRTHFVTPVLVAQVRFSEWTRDGMLRHPSFEGLRVDKPAAEVRRELPGESLRG